MNEPIKAGDLCEVVAGLGRHKSPNIGLQVTVESLQGEHSVHGRVWRCRGKGVMQLSDGGGVYIQTDWADFPASWLRKIPPPSTPDTSVTTSREITA